MHPTEMYVISSCTSWTKSIDEGWTPSYCGYQPCAV